MSTAKRKVVYMNGEPVDTKQDSVDFDKGGFTGEEEMSETGYAGHSLTAAPGMVSFDVILNGKEDPTWWDPRVEHEIYVDFPDVTEGVRGMTFNRMRAKVTRKSSGATSTCEFSGPSGQEVT